MRTRQPRRLGFARNDKGRVRSASRPDTSTNSRPPPPLFCAPQAKLRETEAKAAHMETVLEGRWEVEGRQ